MLVWIVYVKQRPQPCQNPTPDSRETGLERPLCLFLLVLMYWPIGVREFILMLERDGDKDRGEMG